MCPVVPAWGSCLLDIGRACGVSFELDGKILHIDGLNFMAPKLRSAFRLWAFLARKSIAARLEIEAAQK